MKLDIETVVVLETVMEALAKGVDPTSNIKFPEDTILNSTVLKRYFAEAAELFDQIKENIDVVNSIQNRKITNQKPPFYMQEEERRSIPFSETPISISKFVFSINSICDRGDTKKLKATQITEWLVNQGFLEVVSYIDGVKCKSATSHGTKIGITSIEKTNSRGEKYITNLYDLNAQKFLVEHAIPKIIKILP